MADAGRCQPARFVLEFTAEGGRVEGVLAREGSDELQRFSGWLDLLRLLEAAAEAVEALQQTLAQGDSGGNDVDATRGEGPRFVGLNEPRGPPHHHLAWMLRRGLHPGRAQP